MLYETLLKRRSIRRFSNTPIPTPIIDQLVKSALLAPSSRNIRPWHVIVVDDPALMASLALAKPHGAAFLGSAPVAIAVLADTTKSDVWVEDTAILSAILLLTADELGLGACWCQIRKRAHDAVSSADAYVKALLGAPDHVAVSSVIGVGYAEETIPPYDETALLFDKVSHNRFDISRPAPPVTSRSKG